ncbi:hypothetical protein T484DRAFT_1830367 [Baffinella frigidus]|nr:hypothetical protein T484DRAFT_1830367 [Cryptophyta sp. CCMP2293]
MVRVGKHRSVVSLEHVEEAMLRSRFVTQCWVHAAPGAAFLVAVIVPDQAEVAALCERVPDIPEGATLQEACMRDSVQALIQQDG